MSDKNKFTDRLRQLNPSRQTEYIEGLEQEPNHSNRRRWQDTPRGPTLLRGLAGHSLEMAEVQEEVAAEQQGRLAIMGLDNELNRLVLAWLRRQPPLPPTEAVCREGFFTLICPQTNSNPQESDAWKEAAGGWTGSHFRTEDLVSVAGEHDIILYICAGHTPWQDEDVHWHARLRAAGTPILPIVAWRKAVEDEVQRHVSGQLRNRLGVRPVHILLDDQMTDISVQDPAPDLISLVERVLSSQPRLAIPLAQEAPACRPLIARRVIRSGAWMTLLLGAEPIPLLDLPLHVAMQWKVALQLAAIYDRPGLDYRSKEMAGTVLLNLLVRHGAQQILKLVPLIGWLLSGLLSGLSTWLLGKALVRFYQEDQLLSLSDWRPSFWTFQMPRFNNHRWYPTQWRPGTGTPQSSKTEETGQGYPEEITIVDRSDISEQVGAAATNGFQSESVDAPLDGEIRYEQDERRDHDSTVATADS